MRKVKPYNIKVVFIDNEESKKRLMTAYNRIFTIARRNILERKQQEELQNKQKQIKEAEERSSLTSKGYQSSV